MSREYCFRYRGRSRRRLILEADFEESRVVALMVFNITCIRIVILICVCIKRNVITLELLENSWVYILMSIDLWAQQAIFTQVWVSRYETSRFSAG